MHRVDTSTAVASLPSPQAAGTPGFFTKGDPSTPTPATVPGPDWFNMIQEELYYLVLTAGVTPDATKADFTQVHEAITAMIAARALAGNTDVTLTSPASGQALVYNGSAWVNGTPASAINEIQKTLMLNSLRDGIAEGAASQLVNSWPDPLVDTSGIDTGASSGYVHDAVNDLISNDGTTTTESSSGEWSGNTAGFSFSGSNIDHTSGGTNIKTNDTFAGDFEFYFTLTGSGDVAGVDQSIRIFDTAEDGSFADTGVLTFTHDYRIEYTPGDNRAYVIDPNDTSYTHNSATGSACSVRRSGTEMSFWVGESKVHTFPTSSDKTLRVSIGGVNTGADLNSVSWVNVGDPTNMDVTLSQRNPLAVPTTGHFIMLVNNTGSNVYGTDITIEMSRDDGSTYDTATIEELGTTPVTIDGSPVDCDVLYIEPTFTGASEQNLRVHIESFNNKTFQIAGVIPASS